LEGVYKMCEVYKNLDLENIDGEIWKEISGNER